MQALARGVALCHNALTILITNNLTSDVSKRNQPYAAAVTEFKTESLS